MSEPDDGRTSQPRITRDGSDLSPLRTLGFGGMGEVVEVDDRNLGRRLAMKVMHRDLGPDDDASTRFMCEARLTAQLEHPNIVPVHELGQRPDGALYFTMRRVDGETLTDIIRSQPLQYRSPDELFRLLQVFLKVCDAVAFAHSRGLIHRDIKPDNIMVGRFGEVYLMDWGIARSVQRAAETPGTEPGSCVTDASLTARGVALGTPSYMSPEQARGDSSKLDERSDIFCLGAVLYQILTHQPPFPDLPAGELFRLIERCQIPEPQSHTGSPLPPRLCKITMRALSRRPEDRHQTVHELQKDLERFLQSGWQFPVRSYAAGAIVVREGSEGDSAFAIVSGSCRAYQGSGSEQRDLRIMKAGEVFGETAVFARQKRTATVETLEASTFLEISREIFEHDLGMGPWIGLFVKALADRFAEKDRRVAELESELSALRARTAE